MDEFGDLAAVLCEAVYGRLKRRFSKRIALVLVIVFGLVLTALVVILTDRIEAGNTNRP